MSANLNFIWGRSFNRFQKLSGRVLPQLTSLMGRYNPTGKNFFSEKMLQEFPERMPNSLTPACVLAELAKDNEESVRRNVAANPSTPASVLAELAKDKEQEVRSNAAANPSTPANMLELLSRS